MIKLAIRLLLFKKIFVYRDHSLWKNNVFSQSNELLNIFTSLRLFQSLCPFLQLLKCVLDFLACGFSY